MAEKNGKNTRENKRRRQKTVCVREREKENVCESVCVAKRERERLLRGGKN